jgi:hypothetical protein
MQPYGDNCIPLITETNFVHTPERPFCKNPGCRCHLSKDARLLNSLYFQGLVTLEEAVRIAKGEQDFR